MHIVLNRSPSRLWFSQEGLNWLMVHKIAALGREPAVQLDPQDFLPKRRPICLLDEIQLARTDPVLKAAISELGTALNGPGVDLERVKIPDSLDWTIYDVCGIEFVAAAGDVWPKPV